MQLRSRKKRTRTKHLIRAAGKSFFFSFFLNNKTAVIYKKMKITSFQKKTFSKNKMPYVIKIPVKQEIKQGQ